MIEPDNAEVQLLKEEAAEFAVNLLEPGMVVGLGTGTTSLQAVQRIAELIKDGYLTGILGVPTSLAVEQEARRMGIPITTLEEYPNIDLTIDGADEVDPNLNIIKGHGGALLREKIVALSSRREVIIIDERKLSLQLGSLSSVPVEAVPFGMRSQHLYLQSLGAAVTLRLKEDGTLYYTDQGNVIFDCKFGPIEKPQALAALLKARTGVVEHGLFLGIATDVIIATHNQVYQWRRILPSHSDQD